MCRRKSDRGLQCQGSAVPGVVAGVTPLPAVASCVLMQPEAGKAVVAECRGEGPR